MRFAGLILCVLVVIAAAACSRPAARPGTIPPEQAESHIGQTVTVEGVVNEVHTARSGSATFIDMGGSYPANVFTGVIFASEMEAVGDVSDLGGKTVETNGEVRMYRGKPEIVISSRNQIRTP
jgi:hypothetical protein